MKSSNELASLTTKGRLLVIDKATSRRRELQLEMRIRHCCEKSEKEDEREAHVQLIRFA